MTTITRAIRSLASVSILAATIAASASGQTSSTAPKLYASDGSELSSWHAVAGRVMLKPGEKVTVTLSGPAAFENANSYQCVATKGMGSNLVMVIEVTMRAGDQLDISSTTNKGPFSPVAVSYLCVGK